ncbi:hypothetical protein [Pollutibacter soli]|uniref:hypothetical protein n=1 Tax=Pollutibacter soli TaxID=3034157 RepID=UPI0030133359
MDTVLTLRKVRDFGQSLGDTIQFIKLNWKKLFTLYLVFAVPFLLVAALVGASAFADFFQNIGGFTSPVLEGVSGNSIIAFFGAMLLYALSAGAFGTSVYLYMKLYDQNRGKQPEINEIGKLFFPKLLSNFGYTVIAGIIFCGFAFIAIIPIIGFLVVFFGFFYVAISLSLLYPINTIETNGFGVPLQRCFSLIRGKWWYTFGFLIILMLIFYFFSMIIGMVVNLIFGISSLNFLEPDKSLFTKRYFLITGLSSVVQQIFYLLIYVGIGIHYFSLREEKEGTALDERLDQLGSNDAHGQIEEQY